MTDFLPVPLLLQFYFGGCYCYQLRVRVGLRGILKVMPLCASLALRVWLKLKGLTTVMSLLTAFVLMLLSLYAALIERIMPIFDQFLIVLLYYLHCNFCFRFYWWGAHSFFSVLIPVFFS